MKRSQSITIHILLINKSEKFIEESGQNLSTNRADWVKRPKGWSKVCTTDRILPFLSIFYTFDHPLDFKTPLARTSPIKITRKFKIEMM